MNQVYIDCGRQFSLAGRISCRIALWSRRIALWRRRAAERRELLRLDARDLADIGVRGLDARREAAKPFWRP